MTLLHRLECVASAEQAELASALLALEVAHGWEEESLPDGSTLFRIHSHTPEFCDELAVFLKSRLPAMEVRRSQVEEKDWVSTWKEFFTPVPAGKHFMVLAPWMDRALGVGRHIITIEPKTAFGTGHHATTALCLEALSDLYDAGRVPVRGRFLDVGTGSGILGIGAVELGLSGVGVDPDLLAVENAVENRGINGIAPECFIVRRGSLETVVETAFDVVLANILAEPLLNMCAALCAKVKTGGSLVLSGILQTQSDAVASAYSTHMNARPRRINRDEWTALVWPQKQ